MPNKKLPDSAFSFYVGLGLGRSYGDVAKEYDVSKRTVTERARKEKWQERCDEMDRQAQEAINRKTQETLEAMNDRQLKVAKLLQAKAVEALTKIPLDKQADILKALDLGWKQERIIRGEPSERTQISIEEIIKRESERWLVHEDAE